MAHGIRLFPQELAALEARDHEETLRGLRREAGRRRRGGEDALAERVEALLQELES